VEEPDPPQAPEPETPADAGPRGLDQWLRGRALAPEVFLRLALPMAAALAELHGRPLVHRALSPRNVLVDRDGRVSFAGAGAPGPGTLPYGAPEQTGRIGRAVDVRSDLYALGAIYFEMLTGAPPFGAPASLDLLHAHLAREPTPPHRLNPDVPAGLSALVLRLLAKMPEDRYQSARALLLDLEHAQHLWQRQGTVAPFPLGASDLDQALPLPAGLYGRDIAFGQLREAWERAQAGAVELVLLTGPEGVGKSSLAGRLGAAAQASGGQFISVLFHVLQGTPLLDSLRAAIPGLSEALAGPSASPGSEGDPRPFESAFQLSAGAWLRRQPVLLFLDDLRWVDRDSLRLVDLLLASEARPRLLIVGAIRETPEPDHPLSRWLASLQDRGVSATSLELAALATDQVAAFLGDALGEGPEVVRPLAAVLLRKTAGNPLALRQLLRTLQQRKLLVAQPGEGGQRRWRWDLPAIERLRASDDVADLMIAAVKRLPEPARKLLAMAACFGPVAPLALLAAAGEQDQDQTLAALAPATESGLVVLTSDGAPVPGNGGPEQRVQFVHDWVASAAHQLITEGERQHNHLRIGRLLLARAQHDPTATIAAADQMNRAQALLQGDDERIQLAQLNLLAGRLARTSLAPERALTLLEHGLAVLPPGVEAESSSRQGLRFALYRDAVAVAASLGTTEPVARLFDQALKHARSPLEAAELYELRAIASTARLDYATGLDLAMHGLRLLGIEPPTSIAPEQLDAELRALEVTLQTRSQAELVGMPRATDARASMAARLYQALSLTTYVVRPDLFPQVPLAGIRLMLEHGLFRESPGAYLGYALLVQRRLGDYRRAHAIGRLALEMADRLDPGTLCQAVGIFVAVLIQWVEPLRNISPLVDRAVPAGMVAGEYVFAVATLVTAAVVQFHQGAELARVEDEIRRVSAAVGQIVRTEQETLLAYSKVIARLRGLTRDRECIEAEMDAREPGRKRQGMGACRHEVQRMMVSYLLGEFAEARRLGQAAVGKLMTFGRSLGEVEHNFYTSLTLAAEHESTPRDQRPALLQAIADNQRRLTLWARLCPENFLHKRLLVEAELGRLQDRPLEAAELYQQAIDAAAAEHVLHEEALANELAGRFHRGGNRRRFGQMYLQRAAELYRRWGARAKVAQLEREFPDLPPVEGPAELSGAAGPVDGRGLDVEALLRTVETLSREVDEDRLLGRLVEVCLVAAGARRVALLLEEQGRLCLRATGNVDQPPSVLRQPPEAAGASPLALVEQVRRSGEVLVRPDAVVLPILRQGRFVAALYLENQLLADAFSPERIRFLHLLSGQIATSLDNARLFRDAQDAIRLRDEFLAVASHELNTPLASLRLTVQGLEDGSLGEGQEERARRLRLVARQVRRLNLLVDDLLDMAQIQSGQLRMRREIVDLAQLARETAERFGEQAGRSNTPIRVTADRAVAGLWDRARLEQVLSNLLSNALKFAPGRPIEVSVLSAKTGATLVVEDHGPGIDPERLPHIFGRFERGVPVTSHGGLGLGLYIVREIVQALGGQITAASEPGRGARFTVVLPDSASERPPAAH
jgi:predicted ATPase/signal transduction histidine kinase